MLVVYDFGERCGMRRSRKGAGGGILTLFGSEKRNQVWF